MIQQKLSNEPYRILIATKTLQSTKAILDDFANTTDKIELCLVSDQRSILGEALKFAPGMVILDIDMFIAPTAAEVVKLLRRQQVLSEIRIVLIRTMMVDLNSAGGLTSNQACVQQCLANGASHYAGHLNRDSFLEIVQQYCK